MNIDHSLIAGSGGSANWDWALGLDDGNNLDADPLFVDLALGDLQLGLGSPAIDAGDSTVFGGLPAYDLGGNLRIIGANVDMGAYESLDSGNNAAAAVEDLPTFFGLQAAYPNPFNPAINLVFEIDHQRDIKMTIFDVRGRAVRTLAEGNWAAGTHTLKWNGTDTTGKQVAAGVYFARLQSDGWVSDRKLVMVK